MFRLYHSVLSKNTRVYSNYNRIQTVRSALESLSNVPALLLNQSIYHFGIRPKSNGINFDVRNPIEIPTKGNL